ATTAAIGAISLLAIVGASRVEIQDSWIDNFSRSSALRRATDRVNERLLGVHRLEVHLDLETNDAFERGDVLAALERSRRSCDRVATSAG
ncbi:MAG: hypothetical protein HC897_20245, partial [Thermoanaerobaculia bacterium]|nr:hypothetical protein [Thermoanaerobaculia bacterium]